MALKVLTLPDADASMLERFRREPNLLAFVGAHPHLVRLHAAGEHDGRPWFAMDLVDGTPLDAVIARRRIAWPEACRIARGVALGLEHLHRMAVLHRDLKPANILLERGSGTPRIVDFGLALDELAARQTASGIMIGTPLYMPPEQHRALRAEIGPRSDLYALGAILWEMLTGAPPNAGRSILELVALAEKGVLPEPPRELALPPAVVALCRRLLAARPADRPASAAEVAAALEPWSVSSTAPTADLFDAGAAAETAALPKGAAAAVVARAAAARAAVANAPTGSVPADGRGPVEIDQGPPPERLGAYRLDEELGRGGMGRVFAARDAAGREVAVKVVARGTPEALARFFRERRLLAGLAADGFVPLLDAGDSPHGPYLVMPRLRGGSLAERLRARGALPVDEVVSLALALSFAIGRAHAQGIVHRDLKPSNVLFERPGGPPLVADLGLAKHFRLDVPGGSQSVSLTREGKLGGTAGYVAPEQMRDARAARPPADVFSLGAVLYECLTGRTPFSGATFLVTLEKTLSGAFEPVASLRPDAPPWLAGIVERCLAAEPGRRFANARVLRRALELRDPAHGQRDPRAVRALLAGGAALALLLVGLGGWALARRLGVLGPAGAGAPVADDPATTRARALERAAALLAAPTADPADLARAAEEAERARALSTPGSADEAAAARLLGLARARGGDFARALEPLRRARGALADDADPELLEALARSENETDADAGRALEHAVAAIARAPGSAGARLEAGVALERLGANERALVRYQEARERAPDDPRVLVRLGRALAAADRLAEARDLLARAVELAPRDARVRAADAALRLRAGDRPGAEAGYRAALQLDPRSIDARAGLAGLLLEGGQAADAELLLSTLVAQEPGLPAAWADLALARRRLGRLDLAADAIARARALEPGVAAHAREAGRIDMARQRPEEAREAFSVATRLAPDDPEASIDLISALMQLERLDEARRELARIVQLAPTHPRVQMAREALGR